MRRSFDIEENRDETTRYDTAVAQRLRNAIGRLVNESVAQRKCLSLDGHSVRSLVNLILENMVEATPSLTGLLQ